METKIEGLVRDLNPGPLAPKARIIPLDQRAIRKEDRNDCIDEYGVRTVYKHTTVNSCQIINVTLHALHSFQNHPKTMS